jgi:ABC-type polysaccharide/polyol phosphate export permease
MAQILPLTHTTTIVRDLSFNIYPPSELVGILYIAVLTVMTFYISVYMMKRRLIN